MQKEKGFTLIELMVTIAVLAIIAGIAAPSFNTMMANHQLKRNIMELKASLQEARSQALLTRERTVVCLNKNNAGTVVTQADCVQKLTGHASMSEAFKKSNVFVVERNSKVAFDSTLKDDFFTFDKRGTAAPKVIKLCGGNNAYTLTLTVAGTIKTELGGTC